MKKVTFLILALALALSPTALAYNPARFEGVEGITVNYDPAAPSSYTVSAGFTASSEWTQYGGHLLVRYMNAGRAEEIPLILTSFTTSGISGTQMYVRTDAHRYQVSCTDLSAAGLNIATNEAVLLLSPESAEMLRDIVQSVYCSISIWNETPIDTFTFYADDETRRMLSLFLEEYDAEIAPLLTGNSALSKVYAELSPAVQTESASDIGDAMRAILNTEYPTLKRGNQGDEVAQLQEALIQLGHLNDVADGVFGKRTETAVQSFQRTQDLPTSGVADAATQAALRISLLETAPAE